MGNILATQEGGADILANTSLTLTRIKPEIKKKVFRVIKIHIPYNQLAMIRVLQKEFDYEVKGTIYVDHDHMFKSFEVRTDSSALYSYGASDWRISFHTHPDKTAQKYGMRYYSPPSPEDVMEIYDHSLRYVPDNTQSGFGELSIIFANEGIYVLQVDRDKFAKFNTDALPVEALEEILNQTLTECLVVELKEGIRKAVDGTSINSKKRVVVKKKKKLREGAKKRPRINRKGVKGTIGTKGSFNAIPEDMDGPDISLEQFTCVLQRVSRKVSELYGFDMKFYSWGDLQKTGLTLNVCNYFLNKKVID